MLRQAGTEHYSTFGIIGLASFWNTNQESWCAGKILQKL